MARNKYRNKPTIVDGVRFASKAEAKRDAELQLLQRAGEIDQLIRQPRIPIVVNGEKIGTYVGDWRYRDLSAKAEVIEDKKGAQTPLFKWKWRLAKALYPEIEWRLS